MKELVEANRNIKGLHARARLYKGTALILPGHDRSASSSCGAQSVGEPTSEAEEEDVPVDEDRKCSETAGGETEFIDPSDFSDAESSCSSGGNSSSSDDDSGVGNGSNPTCDPCPVTNEATTPPKTRRTAKRSISIGFGIARKDVARKTVRVSVRYCPSTQQPWPAARRRPVHPNPASCRSELGLLLDCRLILSPICRPLAAGMGFAVLCSAALAEAARSEALRAQSDMQVASCATMPPGLGSPARLLAQALTEAWAQQEDADSSERSVCLPTRVRPSDEARPTGTAQLPQQTSALASRCHALPSFVATRALLRRGAPACSISLDHTPLFAARSGIGASGRCDGRAIGQQPSPQLRVRCGGSRARRAALCGSC